MSNKSKIEICANSVESAVKAQQAGAYRVELCAGIPEGGTTPSFGEIRMARQLLNQTKLHVIIRPRGGDFLYSPIEQEIMLHDIKWHASWVRTVWYSVVLQQKAMSMCL